MAKFKTFLDVSRYERAGAIAILLLLVVVFGAHWLLSHRKPNCIESLTHQEREFLLQCDSINAIKNAPRNYRQDTAKKQKTTRHNTQRAKETKPSGGSAPSYHQLAPVPIIADEEL